MIFFFFILASAFLLIGIEFVKRRFLIPVYITRKIAHLGGACIAYVAPFFLSWHEVVLISIIFAVALFVARGTRLLSSIHTVPRATLGEVFLPIGVLLCSVFFLPHQTEAFQFGVLVMGVSDGLAGIIGERFGGRYFRLFHGGKSLEGASVFFFSSLVLTLLFVPGFDYRVFVVPVILTVAEFVFAYGLDNLILPVLGAYLISCFI